MASVRGKLPAARKERPEVEKRRERRVLLPSNRVAVFAVPNVGEFLELRAEAVRRAEDAARSRGRETSTDAMINIELGKLVLRKQLVGLTPEPVPMLYIGGTFDEAALREKLEADSAANVQAGKPALDIERIVAQAEVNAGDDEAMKATARPQPVTDLVWDEQESAAGEYLARCPTAGMDTPEGADWAALNDFATLVMPSVMRGMDLPKDPARPRIRPLR